MIEKLSKFQGRENVVGESGSVDNEWIRERRKKELRMLLPVVKELKPILDDVNEGWLDNSGKIEGPYIRKGDDDYNYAFVGIDLKKKPEIGDSVDIRDGNGYFALRLRVDRYKMVRVVGANEEIVWGSVPVDDEELKEKVEEIVFEVVTETEACH